jgi:hypothetical protein
MIRFFKPGLHLRGAVPDTGAAKRSRHSVPQDWYSASPDLRGIERGQILPAHLWMLR